MVSLHNHADLLAKTGGLCNLLGGRRALASPGHSPKTRPASLAQQLLIPALTQPGLGLGFAPP
jgi:hypothetical protein